MSPSPPGQHRTDRPIAEIARGWAVDERLRRLVPGFDAPFFQAGLAGYSDGAMRLVARRHGCPYCVTEALLDQTLISGGKGRTREDPDLLASRGGAGGPRNRPEAAGCEDAETTRALPGAGLHDHPIAGQIIGSDPGQMAEAASILLTMNYDVVDVNLACPVRKIRRRNRGGHLLAAPDEAIAILEAVRRAVPEDVPLTVKMRRAYDDSPRQAEHFHRIFDAAYDLGYAWATVHCRTVVQKYEGPSRWEFLVDLVKRHPDRLILGSGDIWTARDIFAMLEVTGVSAVAVARGCIGNPWIFRQARQLMSGRPPEGPTLAEQRRALLDHFDLSMRLWGERAASRMMRKFGIRFAMHHPDGEAVKAAFITCRTAAEWRGVIERHYSQ
ncbi:MAG: tRNA-dihydrouridine synthase family protein [Planctomycetota bacterium]|nr:tRNA-dihydrouridine synthase family protein [Planctomycetota bacterium]